jgi:hypothetical protein
VSLDSLIQKLQKLGKVIDNVSDKVESGSRVFSYEERNALIEAGMDSSNFVMTGYDTWVYLGETVSLLGDLKELSSKIYSEMIGDIDKQVERGNVIDSKVGNTSVVVDGTEYELTDTATDKDGN